MIFGEGWIMFLWGWLPISEQMTTYTYNMGRPNYTQWIYKMNIILKTGYEVGIVSGGWKVDMSDMSGYIYIYISGWYMSGDKWLFEKEMIHMPLSVWPCILGGADWEGLSNECQEDQV